MRHLESETTQSMKDLEEHVLRVQTRELFMSQNLFSPNNISIMINFQGCLSCFYILSTSVLMFLRKLNSWSNKMF